MRLERYNREYTNFRKRVLNRIVEVNYELLTSGCDKMHARARTHTHTHTHINFIKN